MMVKIYRFLNQHRLHEWETTWKGLKQETQAFLTFIYLVYFADACSGKYGSSFVRKFFFFTKKTSNLGVSHMPHACECDQSCSALFFYLNS